MPRSVRLVLSCLFVPALAGHSADLAVAGPASAHEERPAQFPSGKGTVPKFLGYDNPNSRVVCKPASQKRIAEDARRAG